MPNYWVEPLGLQLHGSAVANFSNPTSFASLEAWFDASQIAGLTSGQSVSTWTPVAGNASVATNYQSGDKEPVFVTGVINELPVVRYDGVDDVLRTELSSAFSQPYTIYLVGAFRDEPAVQYDYLLGETATSPLLGAYDSGGGTILPFAYAGGEIDSTNTISTEFNIFGAVFNGASSVVDHNGTETAGSLGAGDLSQILQLCGEGRTATLDLAELIIYTAAQDSSARSTIRNYLSTKYNITVS